MKEKWKKLMCFLGFHDLHPFMPEWQYDLPLEVRNLHWKYVCNHCGQGF